VLYVAASGSVGNEAIDLALLDPEIDVPVRKGDTSDHEPPHIFKLDC